MISAYDNSNNQNQVLIQPQLEDLTFAGVMFSVDIDTGAPYYVISYDQSFDGITSGASQTGTTIYRSHFSPIAPSNPWISNLIQLEEELRVFFSYDYLDIEFAVTSQNQLILLQVRPLPVNHLDMETTDFTDALLKIKKKIDKLSLPHPDLAGEGTIFGVMPDWNPAEILGAKPRPLALITL